MKKIFIANWKMNLNQKAISSYLRKIKTTDFSSAEIVLAPAFPYLSLVFTALKKNKIKIAAQDVASTKEGAFTGEVSAKMLKDFGVKMVLIGHSERRHYFHEGDDLINEKVKQTLENGLTPILCIGETLAEKVQGQRSTILNQQLRQALKNITKDNLKKIIIAYEPVWAIGTGNVVTEMELDEAFRVIKRTMIGLLGNDFFEKNTVFVYGGSVDEKNIVAFKKIPYLQGFLIGGASLTVEKFKAIIQA